MSSCPTRRHVAFAATAAAAIVLTTAAGAAAAAATPTTASVPTVVLSNDVLPGLSQAAVVGTTASDTKVEVGITLARPHPAAEATFKRDLYTKGSADFHQFLTPAQFDARFGVPQATYDAVKSWATRDGMTIAASPDSRDFVLLAGTAAQAEQTFAVTLRDYRDSSGRYFANANAPTVPAGDAIDGVIGLNSKLRSHTFHNKPAASAPHGVAPAQDTCNVPGACVGLTTPQDLWSVYDQPTDNYGQGQRMAIFGEGQTAPVITNLRTFEGLHKLPQIPVNVVLADGPKADYSDSSGEVEWDLDTQSSTGMAPQALGETLYFGKDLSDASVLNVFNAWADDPNGPPQASASYGECEENPIGNASAQGGYGFSAGTAYTLGSEAALSKAVMEGRTLFSSTGDTGSSCPIVPVDVNGVGNEAFPVVNYPASSPNAVAVGGTVLYTDGKGADQTGLTPSGASRSEEYSWTFTGGGTSVTFAKPSYQNNVAGIDGYCVAAPDGSTDPPGSTPCRGVPDIAAQSGDVPTNGYAIVAGGETAYPGGGTSLSSPLSLGMWTRIQAAAPAVKVAGKTTYPGLGFANATYYKDYAAHPADFFDVGGGASSPPVGNGLYTSTPGWDYTSGMGVPDISAIAKHVDGKTAATNPKLPTYPTATSPLNPCAAQLFTDTKGDDAYIADPAGSGSNPQLDILAGNITDSNNALHTSMTIANLTTDGAQAAGAANLYYTLWTFKGTQYFSEVQVDTTTGDVTYSDGTVDGNTFTTNNTDTGTFTPGANGTATVNVPLANVGSPAKGDILVAPAGQTRVLAGTTATGGFIEQADVGGPRYDYQIGATCDKKAPTYTVTKSTSKSGVKSVVITVQDAGSGIATTAHVALPNAKWTGAAPKATYSPSVATLKLPASRVNQKAAARVTFDVADKAGNVTHVAVNF